MNYKNILVLCVIILLPISGYGQPVPPSTLTFSSKTSSGFTAAWNVVSGAAAYSIYVANNPSFNGVTTYTQTSTTKVVTGLASSTTYYVKIKTHSSTGTSGYSQTWTVTTNAGTPTAPTGVAVSNNSPTAITISWQPVSGATTYVVEVANSSSFSNPVYADFTLENNKTVSNLNPATQYYYRVKACNNSGCSAHVVGMIYTLTLPPIALAASDISMNSFRMNWAPVTGVSVYSLDVSTESDFSSFVTGFNGKSVTGTSVVVSGIQPNGIYYYRLRARNSIYILSEYSNIVTVNDFNRNYIRSVQTLVPSITDIESLPDDQKIVKLDFFDGLGRPEQIVMVKNSPQLKDIVQPIAYDAFGREAVKYLPYVSEEENGWFKNNFVAKGTMGYTTSDQYNFYNNASTTIAQDTKPYAETIFEPSPLNRAVKQFGAGADWHANNKHIGMEYLINNSTTEDVIAWDINASNMPVHHAVVANHVLANGYYATGQLFVNVAKDEAGNAVREYTNKSGQVVLKKVQAVASPALNNYAHWASTYYVYDDFGDLRFVLPPELTKTIHGGTGNPSQANLDTWAFQYKYDGRRRMIEKKVPGAGWVYMVYDKRDRLVLTQDANQRAGAAKYWTFTKYDALNRPILTGIYASPNTRTAMQDAVDLYYTANPNNWSESYSTAAGHVHNYTNISFPLVSDPNSYLSVTYYDNYSFRSNWVGTYTYTNDGLSKTTNTVPYAQPAVENQRVVGLVTGAKVKVLDGGLTGGYTWLKSINYYDDKYRVVQMQSDNYKGGVDRVSNLYDFTGKVLKSKGTHTESDVTWKNVVGARVEGNKLIDVAPTGWGNSGASSTQVLPAGTDGWIEVTVSETNLNRVIGFSDADTDQDKASIDYGIYHQQGNYYIYENNVNKFVIYQATVPTAYAVKPGDVLKIERVGSSIKYYWNNTLLYTSSTPSSTVLMVDAALYNTNSTIVGVRTSFSTTTKGIIRDFDYDHAGRLTHTWHQVDSGPNILLTKNEYNELGELVDKKLHSTVATASDARQSVDYRYNIRGWLTSMNNAALSNDGSLNDDTNDFFGMQLSYNTIDPDLANDDLYNGNISAIKWSNYGGGPIKQKGYTYTYDPMNRITGSVFKEKATSWNALTGSKFAETGFSYDLNGNILGLTRNDKRTSGPAMDVLTYNYGTGATQGNRLLKVSDAGDKFKGFVDDPNNNATNDYTYDHNGNMTRDLNKGIGTSLTDNVNLITYNYLNLPEKITKSGNSIQYIYDASGRKLSQVATYGTATKQTGYVGEFVYENDALQFISHEEGRIVMASPKLVAFHDGETTAGITASNATLVLADQNGGEKYVKATSNGTVARTGMFPVGNMLNVTAGERYKIRMKGYRTGANAANLLIKANGADLDWPGAAVPLNASAESWIEQTVTIPDGATILEAGVVWGTVTSGQVVYLNGFEITKLETVAPEYQYNLKDHLGNNRLTFTTKLETVSETATLETENMSSEQGKFVRYANARRVQHYLFDRTKGTAPTTTTGSAQRLSGYGNEIYGLAKSLSVMPGDVVSMEVYAKYIDPDQSNWSEALTTLISQIAAGAAPVGVVVDGGGYTTSTSSFPFPGGLNGTGGTTGEAPKAYLNWLVFDRHDNLVLSKSGFKRMSTDAKENGDDVEHEHLFDQVTISEPGYIYIYLSNEDGVNPYEVYFDDFKVDHQKSPVIQTDDYYPFGLTFNSYSRENTAPNKYLYQGKESQSELGLDVYDFHWRVYDKQIGRTWQMDPFSGEYTGLSPYSWAANNPISIVDPDGRNIEEIEGGVRLTGRHARRAFRAMCPKCGTDQGGSDDETAKNEATYWAQVGSDRPGYVSSEVRNIDREFAYLRQNGYSETADFFKEAYQGGDLTTAEIAQLARLRTEVVGKIKAQYMMAVFNPETVGTFLGIGIFGFASPATQNRLFGFVPRGGNTGQGFKSFSAFKRAFGAAGEGNHWHHIVEQTPGNIERFGSQTIQNTNNLVRVNANIHIGKGSISAYYSSAQPFTNGLTVRQWLSGQSFAQQSQFGLKVLEAATKGLPFP